MAKDEFNQEILDKMYDDAMKWTPPSQSGLAAAAVDPKATLQKLINARKGGTNAAV